MLSPVRAVLVLGAIAVYEFDVSQFISRELWDRAVRREKLVLAFPCLITQIFLEAGVPKLPTINQFIKIKNATDWG